MRAMCDKACCALVASMHVVSSGGGPGVGDPPRGAGVAITGSGFGGRGPNRMPSRLARVATAAVVRPFIFLAASSAVFPAPAAAAMIRSSRAVQIGPRAMLRL